MASTTPMLGYDFNSLGVPNFQSQLPSTANAFNQASQGAASNTAQPSHANPVSGVAKTALNKFGSEVGKLGSSIKQGVDAFGVNNLGLGQTVYSGMGPGTLPWNQPGMVANSTLAGEAGTTTLGGLGAGIGGAFSGYDIGSLIGGWLGGNQQNAAIGGALGGALGAVALGGLSGVAMGATLGSVVPGIGTVIGAVAGSVLGGMFGGKKPNPAGNVYNNTISADGSITPSGTFNGKHIAADAFNPALDDFSSYLKGQSKKYGINYSDGLAIDYGYDVNGGSFGDSTNNTYIRAFTLDGKSGTPQISFDANDPAARQRAYKSAWENIVQYSGQDPNSLKAYIPTSAADITIKANVGPSDWDKFLAEQRSSEQYD